VRVDCGQHVLSGHTPPAAACRGLRLRACGSGDDLSDEHGSAPKDPALASRILAAHTAGAVDAARVEPVDEPDDVAAGRGRDLGGVGTADSRGLGGGRRTGRDRLRHLRTAAGTVDRALAEIASVPRHARTTRPEERAGDPFDAGFLPGAAAEYFRRG